MLGLRMIEQASGAQQSQPGVNRGVIVRRGLENQIKVFGFHAERLGNSLER